MGRLPPVTWNTSAPCTDPPGAMETGRRNERFDPPYRDGSGCRSPGAGFVAGNTSPLGSVTSASSPIVPLQRSWPRFAAVRYTVSARVSRTYTVVIVVVTGVSSTEPPAVVGAVSVSGMNPDVDATRGVGGGEYGTSGSTPLSDGDVGEAVVVVEVVAVELVHAIAASTKTNGSTETGRDMGTSASVAAARASAGRYVPVSIGIVPIAWKPPSTWISSPVIPRARSENRKLTVSPTGAGSPASHPSGACSPHDPVI